MIRWRKHKVLVLFVGVLISAGLAALVFLAPPAANVSLNGNLTLGAATTDDLTGVNVGDVCSGRRSLADITSGAKVVVYNGNTNTALQTSVLENGRVNKYGNCVFNFSLAGVSRVSSYSIAVGQRPRYNYSYSDLVANKFKLKLVLGELSSKELAPADVSKQGTSSSKNYQLQDVTGSQNTAN